MTTEHDNKRISETYSELARETTPDELDARVLAMATRETRSRYGLARAWVRPVAWAAMIGISLAFVLEMTWFTDVPDVATPAPFGDAVTKPADEPVAPEATFKLEEASLSEDVDQPARLQVLPARRETAVADPDMPDPQRHCDSEARASADSWYACIRQLREQGLDDEASAELKALLRAFPDFREPSPK